MKEKDEILDEAQVYEVGFHILPGVSEEDIQSTVSKLREVITANDGVVFAEEFPKMRDLAYEIKKRLETKYLKFNKAYFGWMKFEVLASAIAKISEGFENNKNVLRFMVIKTVRENTMHTPKMSTPSRSLSSDEVKIVNQIVPEEKIEVSEEEIDKSIDELLVNEVEK